jgi:uncharacterized membrane protein
MFNPFYLRRFILVIFFLSLGLSLIEFITTILYLVLKLSDSETTHLISGQIWNFSGFLCHQLPERSIFIDDIQFPVCNRCIFALSGKIIFVLLYLNKSFRNFIYKNSDLFITIVLPPLLLEAVLKVFFNYASGFVVRSINGFLQGIFLYFLLLGLNRYLSKYHHQNLLLNKLKL